jgi:hypothetical protein
MNSSERHGAKWVIFFCLTCVVMGPVLHTLAWFAGQTATIKWNMGLAGFDKVKFNALGLGLLMASVISSGLYKLSFWYYLGAVARCMRAPSAGLVVGMYALVFGGSAAFTAYILFGGVPFAKLPMYAAAAGAAWLACGIYWVAMIVVVKTAIDRTMGEVRSPLETERRMSPTSYQLAGS